MPQKPPRAAAPRDRKKRAPARARAADPIPVEDPTPPPGPGHLAPRPGESADNHRAFLLWAMQEPSRRSMRATSRALGVGDRTIRRWCADYGWEERARVEASDRLAWAEYLGRYAETYGVRGLAMVQDNMDFPGPMTPLAVVRARLGPAADARAYPEDSAARRVLEDAAETSRRVMGDQLHDPGPDDGPPEPEERELDALDAGEDEEDPDLPPSPLAGKARGGAGGGPAAREGGSQDRGDAPGDAPRGRTSAEEKREQAADPAARRTRVDEHRTLVRATLGVYSQELQAHAQAVAEARRRGQKIPTLPAHLRVRPADLGILIELEQALSDAPKIEGSAGPLESVRVRIAREEGADVLEALDQDHRELGAILEALRQKRAQDAAHLRQEMERRAQVVELRREEAG